MNFFINKCMMETERKVALTLKSYMNKCQRIHFNFV